VWIGRRCWPTFQLLGGLGINLPRMLFLDPVTDGERFWAVDQALRSGGIHAVVADGSGMSQTTSRRLQLAAESGSALALLARPPWEAEEASYAATRWEVRARGGGEMMQWEIQLLSCRGQQRGQDAPPHWNAEWSYQVYRGKGTVHLSPRVGRGAAAAADGAALSRTA